MKSMCTAFLLALASTAANGQSVVLRYETWPEKLATQDRVLRVDVDDRGGISVHRPAHWRQSGECRLTLDAMESHRLHAAIGEAPWGVNRGHALTAQVADRDAARKQADGVVFETSDQVVTVLTRNPGHGAASETFIYENLDWDAARHPDVPELTQWQHLAAALYALAQDTRCAQRTREATR